MVYEREMDRAFGQLSRRLYERRWTAPSGSWAVVYMGDGDGPRLRAAGGAVVYMGDEDGRPKP